MKRILTSLLIFVTLVYVGYSATASTSGKIPPELVDEWATSKSEFARGAITSGSAVYLTGDGTALFIGAAPPIGIRGIAVYDSLAHSLTVTMLDDDDGGATTPDAGSRLRCAREDSRYRPSPKSRGVQATAGPSARLHSQRYRSGKEPNQALEQTR